MRFVYILLLIVIPSFMMGQYCNKYNGHVTDVYDGDTFTCDIDLGLRNISITERVRVYGLNCPEVKGSEREKGLAVRDSLRNLILGEDVIVEYVTVGKYGRLVCIVYLEENMLNINQWLISNGYCKPQEY